jgi:hypothetical protein
VRDEKRKGENAKLTRALYQTKKIQSRKGAEFMKQTAKAAVSMRASAEPLKLLTQIGSTTYKVSIRFSKRSKETMEDKILRLIEREVSNA